MRRAALLAVSLLAAGTAFASAGCGGKSANGSGRGGKALTRSEFVAKADGICTNANNTVPKPPSDIANVNPTASTTTDAQLDEFGDFIDKVVKHTRGEIDDLRKLKPPADLQNTFDRAMATLDEAVNELEDAGKAAHDADREKFKDKVAESQRHSTEANSLAKQLGLTVCGSG